MTVITHRGAESSSTVAMQELVVYWGWQAVLATTLMMGAVATATVAVTIVMGVVGRQQERAAVRN